MSPFEIMDLVREAADAEREKHVRVMSILERLLDEERARNRDLQTRIVDLHERLNNAQEKFNDALDAMKETAAALRRRNDVCDHAEMTSRSA